MGRAIGPRFPLVFLYVAVGAAALKTDRWKALKDIAGSEGSGMVRDLRRHQS